MQVIHPASAIQSPRLPADQGRRKGGDSPSAPCPSNRSHQRYERHLDGCPALAAPQTRSVPQTPVSQGKRELLGERPGQLSQLPPPSAGIAPPSQRRACILPCRGRAAGRSCRLIIRHTSNSGHWRDTHAGLFFSQNEGANRTGAARHAPLAGCKTRRRRIWLLRRWVFHPAGTI